MRSDRRRTHLVLLRNLGDMFADQGWSVSFADLSRRSGVGLATVYRHLHDPETAMKMYLDFVVDDFAERLDKEVADAAGSERFARACHSMVESAIATGPSLVRVRSPLGVLERRQAGDPAIIRYWGLLASVLDDLEGYGGRDKDLDIVLWRSLFDERTILDLHNSLGWSASKISRELSSRMLAMLGVAVRPRDAT